MVLSIVFRSIATNLPIGITNVKNMTREKFIKKWLANPAKEYNEHCKDEMRNDLDSVINNTKLTTQCSFCDETYRVELHPLCERCRKLLGD